MREYEKLDRDLAERVFGSVDYTKAKWKRAVKWCASVEIPAGFESWINTATGAPTRRIYMNEQMHAPFLRVLKRLSDAGLAGELKTFDGCYCVRRVRGSISDFSWHAYALAVDVNAAENPLGSPSRLHPEVVAAFKAEGFVWGGDFRRVDAQHFQWGLG